MSVEDRCDVIVEECILECIFSFESASSRSADVARSTYDDEAAPCGMQIRSMPAREIRHIKLCSEEFDIGRLFALCANTSWSLNRSPIRCVGFAAGVAMRVRAGHIAGTARSPQAAAAGWSGLWTRIEPTFQRFLTDRRRATYLKVACDDVDVEFGRIGRQFLGAAVVEFEMFDRRGRPSSLLGVPPRLLAPSTRPALSLVFSAASPTRKRMGLNRSRTALDRALARAVKRTLEIDRPTLSRLPVSVRHQASGAIQAWRDAWRFAGVAGSSIDRMLADKHRSPMQARALVLALLRSHSTIDFRSKDGRMAASRCLASVVWQAFCARGGVLYEPTDALHRLLDCTDIGGRLALSSITPALPALTISTPPSMWGHRGGIEAISVFLHRSDAREDAGGGAAESAANVVSVQLWSHGSVTHAWGMESMHIALDDPTRSISDAIEDTIDMALKARREVTPPGGRLYRATAERWRTALHYMAKVLLYLSLDDAQVSEERPYTDALGVSGAHDASGASHLSRSSPGVSRHRRTAARAKNALLYDRFLIGPSTLRQPLPAQGGIGGAHPLRTLWRRGRFRMQSHGYRHMQRKVRFDMPVVIRADGPEADES